MQGHPVMGDGLFPVTFIQKFIPFIVVENPHAPLGLRAGMVDLFPTMAVVMCGVIFFSNVWGGIELNLVAYYK